MLLLYSVGVCQNTLPCSLKYVYTQLSTVNYLCIGYYIMLYISAALMCYQAGKSYSKPYMQLQVTITHYSMHSCNIMTQQVVLHST